MNTELLLSEPELHRVLRVCNDFLMAQPSLAESRIVCYKWLVRAFEQRFGYRFHPSRLHQLANLGYLSPEDTARGGHRRYYKLRSPEMTAIVLNNLRQRLVHVVNEAAVQWCRGFPEQYRSGELMNFPALRETLLANRGVINSGISENDKPLARYFEELESKEKQELVEETLRIHRGYSPPSSSDP